MKKKEEKKENQKPTLPQIKTTPQPNLLVRNVDTKFEHVLLEFFNGIAQWTFEVMHARRQSILLMVVGTEKDTQKLITWLLL